MRDVGWAAGVGNGWLDGEGTAVEYAGWAGNEDWREGDATAGTAEDRCLTHLDDVEG